jgi:S1-C subfamily serine protease
MNIKDGKGYYDKPLGSGFLIDMNGYILTNHHVIADHVDPKYKGYSAVYVSMRDEPDKEIPATVVGYDRIFDIALLKIPVKNKTYLSIGRSNELKVGDRIYTIGNPLGLNYSVTSGIISSKERNFFQLGRTFQIDAAVNPGNSGGPMIDKYGQVVGIVFAGIPQFEGLNFVIPFEWVYKTIPLLYKGGKVKRAWLGAGIFDDKGSVNVYYVLPSGPAEKAGIRPGDLIRKIDGTEVKTIEEAQNLVGWKRYPMIVKVELVRGGQMIETLLRLEERPELPVTLAFERDTQGKLLTLLFGLDLEYYDRNLVSNKYKINRIYRKILPQFIDIDEESPLQVYGLKYIENERKIVFGYQYIRKGMGFMGRYVELAISADINTIL